MVGFVRIAEQYDKVTASIVARFNRYIVVVDANPSIMTRVESSRKSGITVGFAADTREGLAEILRMRVLGA